MDTRTNEILRRADAPAAEVARSLVGRIRGRLHTDPVARNLYATDASPYRMLPAAVLRAEAYDDLAAAVEACRTHRLPITPRGAGTSLSGQCVGAGLQLDASGLNAVEWIDPERRLARVGPGTTWWGLNLAAKRHGLEFGPDPATKRQCTIGGMVGTNAGGTHSIIYGATVERVHAVEAILADGTDVRFERSEDGTLLGGGVPPAHADTLEAIRAATAPLLGPQFSTLARRGSGYQLEHLCADRPHLGRFLAGSEGTLALSTAIEVVLDPAPAHRVLALVGFDDLHAAMGAVPHLVETGPCAVELLSRSMVDIARRDPMHAGAVAGIPTEHGAFLFVEYQGDTPQEAAAGFERMDAALEASGGARMAQRVTDPAACARVWSVREAGVGSMSAVAAGPRFPAPFVEDTVVAIDNLPPYIRELDRVFARHDMEPVWYGHASTGLIHVRPFLDMTDPRDVGRIEPLMEDALELVRTWSGDFSGEHGDGLTRTHFNERLFGPELYGKLRELKASFDPDGILNPGKVTDGQRPTDNLRYGGDYRRRELPTAMGFDDQGGFAQAAERCFGAGVCRKRFVGTMCPPAAASGLEEHSTRARANLLRSVVSGDLAFDELASHEAREVMETCVACKACKTECPARVDMARMKTAWSDEVRRREGASAIQWAVARLRPLFALGSPFSAIGRRLTRSAWVKQRIGVAPARTLPEIDPVPLTMRLRGGSGDALLYPDCFTTYQEPEIGEAAAKLCAAAGETLRLASVGCCGRVMLSEGYVERARGAAASAAARLRRTQGPILFCEPSCMSAITDDWQHLIGDVSDIASRCILAEEHIAKAGAGLSLPDGGRALLHGHCHQKALWGTGGTQAALDLVDGLEVDVLDAGCCGMAGAFGYLAERYDLSVAMGERVLAPAVRGAEADTSIVATGTSCRHQIADLTGREAVHPLVFLARRLA